MNVKNIFTLLKILSFRYIVVILLFIVASPSSFVQAQNPDEEGEIFGMMKRNTKLKKMNLKMKNI